MPSLRALKPSHGFKWCSSLPRPLLLWCPRRTAHFGGGIWGKEAVRGGLQRWVETGYLQNNRIYFKIGHILLWDLIYFKMYTSEKKASSSQLPWAAASVSSSRTHSSTSLLRISTACPGVPPASSAPASAGNSPQMVGVQGRIPLAAANFHSFRPLLRNLSRFCH